MQLTKLQKEKLVKIQAYLKERGEAFLADNDVTWLYKITSIWHLKHDRIVIIGRSHRGIEGERDEICGADITKVFGAIEKCEQIKL